MLICSIHDLPASQLQSLKEKYLVREVIELFTMTMIFLFIFLIWSSQLQLSFLK